MSTTMPLRDLVSLGEQMAAVLQEENLVHLDSLLVVIVRGGRAAVKDHGSATGACGQRDQYTLAAVSSTPSASSPMKPSSGSGENAVPPIAGRLKDSSRCTKSHSPNGA